MIMKLKVVERNVEHLELHGTEFQVGPRSKICTARARNSHNGSGMECASGLLEVFLISNPFILIKRRCFAIDFCMILWYSPAEDTQAMGYRL